ncbi:MAG: PKD domain-containing protein [Bacteroidetes bacterium]|nr:PKD domain-containing protein [Bacteroidota bacterium]
MQNFTLLLFSLCSTFLYSQSFCGTDTKYLDLLSKNPALQQKMDAQESFIKQYIATKGANKTNTVKIIPTVFHIIHNYGPENISDAQVIDALRILNEDFRKLNSDTNLIVSGFKGIAADCEIEFRLAQLDPEGKCTDGITRTVSLFTNAGDDNVKTLISWDTDKYLNIWVVAGISMSGVAGFAYYPGTAPQLDFEGVVIEQAYVGSIGTSSAANSRVLTHEVGHFMNLVHTFGFGTCGDASNCNTSVSDFITDTPPTKGNCSTCNLTATSCGVLENVQNYMDYSSCNLMFTTDQKSRMDAALNSPLAGRSNLWSPTNLSFTGVLNTPSVCFPVADFTSSVKNICSGDSLLFTDLSWNGSPTQWQWNFQGGTPASSTIANPTVYYSTPGLYSVTLTCSNSAGQDVKIKTSLINVGTSVGTYSTIFTEGFEGSSIPNSDWDINNPDAQGTWQTSNSVAFTGSKCAFVDNYTNGINGEWEELISPSVNLSTMSNPILSYRVAYARRFSTETDKLEVYYSENCGETWTIRQTKFGFALQTASATSTAFVPGSSNWRKELVNIAPVQAKTNVRFKFKFTSDLGNNLYIDDINVQPLSLSVGEDERLMYNVFPTISSDFVTIQIFDNTSTNNITIKLVDALGKTVLIQNGKAIETDSNNMSLNISHLAKGIYTLNIINNSNARQFKVIKQ